MDIAIMTMGLLFTGLGMMINNEVVTGFGIVLLLALFLAASVNLAITYYRHREALKMMKKLEDSIDEDIKKLQEMYSQEPTKAPKLTKKAPVTKKTIVSTPKKVTSKTRVTKK